MKLAVKAATHPPRMTKHSRFELRLALDTAARARGWAALGRPGEDALRKPSAVIPVLSPNDAEDLRAAIEYAPENPAL